MKLIMNRVQQVRPAIAVALLTVAAALWLSAANFGHAASDTGTEAVGATVTSTIEWDPATCSAATTAGSGQTFSSTAAGGTASGTPIIGCVSSNATWDVGAEMTTLPGTGGGGAGTTMPATAFDITRGQDELSTIDGALEGLLGASILDTTSQTYIANGSSCTSGCGLETATPGALIVDDASANTVNLDPLGIGVSLLGGLFVYHYDLAVPADQAPGNYTGGVVTFTASN